MPYRNYNTQMNAYMKKRWSLRRSLAVAFLGGCCAKCGSDEKLEFDHIDPKTKVMTIARASSLSERRFWEEVKKCQLLCWVHHLEKHNRTPRLQLRMDRERSFKPPPSGS